MFILGHLGLDGDKHSSLLRCKLDTVVKFLSLSVTSTLV